ncbi:Protein lifeguard 1 [Zancudomyces culisetae]|uniref:Protein lifeguard 1 n=1 Tax=Zancudomyces culisetae TaxID=1213189 RepID=A0A1R1PK69_ZANCU|nr:Protein lifeguard 1 [Zancudomyces culisetae]|eukprot:OMH81370.1 Protein lifeguard 1 [Zancudomyces culisetae]
MSYNQGYGNYQGGGYGYDQGGYNQGGYDQGAYNQGGYNQGGYDQSGYNQAGYNQGGYGQPDLDSLDENLSVEQYAAIFSGGSDTGLGRIEVKESVGARDLEGFDMDQMQRDFESMQALEGGDDRGLFGGSSKSGSYSKMHALIAGAAAYQAVKYFENKQKKQGKKMSHSTLKKMVAGFAAAMAVKHFEKAGNMQAGLTRDVVAQQAADRAIVGLESQIADSSQPQYNYSNYGGGEASSYDNQGGYDQGGYNQGGYNQGGYGGYNQGY